MLLASVVLFAGCSSVSLEEALRPTIPTPDKPVITISKGITDKLSNEDTVPAIYTSEEVELLLHELWEATEYAGDLEAVVSHYNTETREHNERIRELILERDD
jgi:hypothetical protein